MAHQKKPRSHLPKVKSDVLANIANLYSERIELRTRYAEVEGRFNLAVLMAVRDLGLKPEKHRLCTDCGNVMPLEIPRCPACVKNGE